VRTENFVTEDKPVICACTAHYSARQLLWRWMLACSLRGEETQFSLCLLRVLNPTNRAMVPCAAARQTSGGGPNHAL